MFCMQKETQVTEIIWGGRNVYLARRRRWRWGYCCCRRRCCGGGRWRCQAALWFQRRLQAVLLSPTVQRRSSPTVLAFSHVPSRFLAFLPLGVGFSVSLLYFGWFSLLFSLFGFSFFGLSPSFSRFFFCFFSSRFLSSFQFFLLVFFFSSFFSPRLFSSPPSIAAVLIVIYRAKWVAFRCGAWGAAGRSAIGRDCQGSAPLPGFLVGARWVVGHCVRSVGSMRESGRQKIQIKATLFPSSPLHVRGEEERWTVSFKTTPFCSSFFFWMYETVSFWIKRTVSF